MFSTESGSLPIVGFALALGRGNCSPLCRFLPGGVRSGAYESRVRMVDLNGFAQPEPRPYPEVGALQADHGKSLQGRH